MGAVEGAVQKDTRQEIEIEIRKRCVEHQRLEKTCPCCGAKNAGDFPPHIQAPVQYGLSVTGLITYLSVYQYLPYRRVTDLFSSVIGLPLSAGTVDAVLEEMAEKAGGVYRETKRRIERSAVVGADETGCHVNGKKHWMYVWQNNELKTPAKQHQICVGAHLLRELKNFETGLDREWSAGMKETIKEALKVSPRYGRLLIPPTKTVKIFLMP